MSEETESPHVMSPEHTTAHLDGYLAEFRARGGAAEPVFIGAEDTAEGVLLPAAAYRALVECAEDAAIAAVVAERVAGAPEPGQGLDNASLTRMVAVGQALGARNRSGETTYPDEEAGE
ncbi:hypothetical protein [Streptomyces sp. NBC_00470]|uniref:hypothetical protein n=1 Tax=Streptomyces sp. NBC_00470 TaxID=2975753 RepID=UPI002F908F71